MIDKVVCLVSFHATLNGKRFGRTFYPNQILEYLTANYRRVLFIGQPMSSEAEQVPFLEEYEKGKLVRKRAMPLGRFFRIRRVGDYQTSYVQHVRDFLSVLLLLNQRVDVLIAMESVNTMAAVLMRRVGLVDTVIFNGTDYMVSRFGNPVLNGAYHGLDRLCLDLCDVAWNPFFQLENLRPYKSEKQIYVPVAAPEQSFPAEGERKKRDLVFLGFQIERSGIMLALNSFAAVVGQVPESRLHIVGSGPMKEEVAEFVRSKNLFGSVILHGSLPDEEVTKVLNTASIALAPFLNDRSDWRYQESSKVKLYVAHGLATVITKNSGSAAQLEAYGAGIVVEATEQGVGEGIVRLLKDDPLRERMELGARRMAHDFSCERVFERGMKAAS